MSYTLERPCDVTVCTTHHTVPALTICYDTSIHGTGPRFAQFLRAADPQLALRATLRHWQLGNGRPTHQIIERRRLMAVAPKLGRRARSFLDHLQEANDQANPGLNCLARKLATGIACWFVDTDYNGESFFVRHAYFLGANATDPRKSLKTTLQAEIDADAWNTLYSDTSRSSRSRSPGGFQ